MRLFIIVGVALLVSGCAPSHQQILETARTQTFAALSACQARANKGEFHTEAEQAACEGDGMIQAHLVFAVVDSAANL